MSSSYLFLDSRISKNYILIWLSNILDALFFRIGHFSGKCWVEIPKFRNGLNPYWIRIRSCWPRLVTWIRTVRIDLGIPEVGRLKHMAWGIWPSLWLSFDHWNRQDSRIDDRGHSPLISDLCYSDNLRKIELFQGSLSLCLSKEAPEVAQRFQKRVWRLGWGALGIKPCVREAGLCQSVKSDGHFCLLCVLLLINFEHSLVLWSFLRGYGWLLAVVPVEILLVVREATRLLEGSVTTRYLANIWI